jgi:hypothetical protein
LVDLRVAVEQALSGASGMSKAASPSAE